MSVVWPTSTPATSVIAFIGPGVPSNGMPRSRARGRGRGVSVLPAAALATEVSSVSANSAINCRDMEISCLRRGRRAHRGARGHTTSTPAPPPTHSASAHSSDLPPRPMDTHTQ